MSANGWGEGAWGDIGWGGLANVSLTPTGLSVTISLGSVTTSGSSPVDVTGFSVTSALGTATSFQSATVTAPSFYNQVHLGAAVASIPVTVDVSGVSGAIESLTAWGKGTWGEGVWGGGVFADVGQTIEVSQSQIVGSLGTGSTITGTSVVVPTGVAGNTLLESVLIGAGAIVTETGLTGSVNIGDEAVVGTSNLTLSGTSASADSGSVLIETDTGAPVTSVPGMTATLGSEAVVISVNPLAVAVAATGSVGSVSLTGTALVIPTGASAQAIAGNALVWNQISPDPGTAWSDIIAA